MKNKRGITLIALIITIIVMLILVAVTINMAVRGGLFGYASNAAKDTKQAMENEQDVSGFEDLVAEYTGQKKIIRISDEIARVKSASSFTLDENDPQHIATGNYVLTIKDGNKEYDFNDTLSVYKDEYTNELEWWTPNFGIFIKAQNTFITCYREKYPDDNYEFLSLQNIFDSAWQNWDGNNGTLPEASEDVNFEYNGVKITTLTYELTSEKSADVYFDAMVDMGRFWLVIPMETSVEIDIDAETGDPRLVLFEFPCYPDLLDISYLENLTPSDVGFSS